MAVSMDTVSIPQVSMPHLAWGFRTLCHAPNLEGVDRDGELPGCWQTWRVLCVPSPVSGVSKAAKGTSHYRLASHTAGTPSRRGRVPETSGGSALQEGLGRDTPPAC
eukprot:2546137-Prymnesium_polylepis.1